MMHRRGLSGVFCGLIALLLVMSGLFACAEEPIWPAESGETKQNGSLTIDVGNASQGYILVTGEETKKKLKFRVKFGETTLTYDINNDGETEIIPLQLGSGDYTFILYKQSSGKKYSQEGKISLHVDLYREDAAFLVPNQHVPYTEDCPAVAKSMELCEGLSSDKKKYEAITKYITKNYLYDYVKALTVKAGELPDIETTMEKGMGICQDLSAMTVCMLRVQGIPARMAVGYVNGDQYHAWVYATINGKEVFFDPTVECNGMEKPKNQKSYSEEVSY